MVDDNKNLDQQNEEGTVQNSEPVESPYIDEDDITFEEDDVAKENTSHDAKAKIAKLKSEIERLKQEKQQYLDGWQRDKAEFLNARKRDEEAKAEFMKFAVAEFVEELLPIVDSFESALKHENQSDGVTMIHNQFKSILKKQGIEEFGNIGDVFDPAKHQAIGNISATDTSKDNTLAEVLQKGYSVHGRVIRPAFVKVFQA